MKRMIKKTACVILAFAVLLTASGCKEKEALSAVTTEKVPEQTTVDVTTPEETTADVLPDGVTLTMTQKEKIKNEDYIGQSPYLSFLNASEKSYLVPGLENNTVPQGLACSPVDGRIYVSSYSSLNNTPSVILVMNSAGEFVAEYFLFDSNGTAFTGHVGGIAVTEHYMYVAVGGDGNGAYCVGEFKLSELPRYGSHSLRIEETVSLPSGVSYLSYHNGILWAGNFYLKGTYDLGSKFNFTTTVDGKAYGGYAAAYFLDKNEAKLKEDDSLGYAKPDFVLATPDKVQGFSYKSGKVFLSISYGRTNDSYIYVYSVSVPVKGKTVKVDGIEYPFETLGKHNLKASYTTMPMTEGLTFDADGKLLVLYESAAMKYSNSRCPTDYIWKMDF